jgi:hypothetical protein
MKVNKRSGKLVIIATLVAVLLLSILVIPVLADVPNTATAAPAVQEAALPNIDLSSILVTMASLTGVAIFISAVTNGLKQFGWVTDGTANAWSAGMNLVVLIGLIVLQVIGKMDLVPVIDSQAGVIASILTAMVGLVYQIWISAKTHTAVLAGLPVVGKSYSGRVAGEPSVVLSVTNVSNTSVQTEDPTTSKS